MFSAPVALGGTRLLGITVAPSRICRADRLLGLTSEQFRTGFGRLNDANGFKSEL
jgi:hypothetical protein